MSLDAIIQEFVARKAIEDADYAAEQEAKERQLCAEHFEKSKASLLGQLKRLLPSEAISELTFDSALRGNTGRHSSYKRSEAVAVFNACGKRISIMAGSYPRDQLKIDIDGQSFRAYPSELWGKICQEVARES